MLARIADWRDGHGKPGGRAEAARRLDEAHKLLDEISDMLTEMRRAGRQAAVIQNRTTPARPGASSRLVRRIVLSGEKAALLPTGCLRRAARFWVGSQPRFIGCNVSLTRQAGTRKPPAPADLVG